MIRRIISRLQRFRDIVRRKAGIFLFDAPKARPIEARETRSILFIRHDAKLGDAIVSSGVISKLRKYRPDIKLMVMTSETMAPMFKQDFQVDDVIVIKKRPSYAEIRQICRGIGAVDMVVSLNQDMKMKDIYLFKCLDSKLNVGLDSGVKRINVNIQPYIRTAHYAEKFDYIATLIGIDGPQEPYMVPVKAESLARVQAFLVEHKLQRYALLNPFGSGSERKLDAAKINQIIDHIWTEYRLPVVVLSAPDTRELLNALPVEFSEHAIHFDQSRSIFDAIAAVELAQLVISVDTAIVHIATGLNKPQIAIYKRDAVNFANWHPNSDLAHTIIATDDINQFELTSAPIKAFIG